MPTRNRPTRIARPVLRNTAARSPLLRKGGAHQRVRSGERQQDKRQVTLALQDWQDELIQTDSQDSTS